MGDTSGPVGTSGGAWAFWAPPCPGAAVAAEPPRTSASGLSGWDPSGGKRLLCAGACHPTPHPEAQDPWEGWS